MTKLKLNVEGMTCHACEMLIGDALTDLGIKNPKVDQKSGIVEFDYDDSKLDKLDIVNAIKKENFKVRR